jgi:hypothetical protein
VPRSGSLENGGILKELADNRSLVGFSHPTTGNADQLPWLVHYGYKVGFDFELKVPRRTALLLKTVNGKEITLLVTTGKFEVDNINRGVDLTECPVPDAPTLRMAKSTSNLPPIHKLTPILVRSMEM